MEEEILGQVEELRKGVKVYKELLQSPAWGQLVSDLRGQQMRLRQEILQSDDSGLDHMIQTAKAKSELAGIQFVLNWPQSMVDMNEEEILSLMEMIQNEEDPE